MTGTIELTPDQLANLVAAVFEANGIHAHGLALYSSGQLVGYDRVVVHHQVDERLEVFPRPKAGLTREELDRMLYPNVSPTFASRAVN